MEACSSRGTSGRGGGRQGRHAPRRERDLGGARERQEQALGQQLPTIRPRPAPSATRMASSPRAPSLSPAAGSHVAAGDEHHQTDGAEQWRRRRRKSPISSSMTVATEKSISASSFGNRTRRPSAFRRSSASACSGVAPAARRP